MKSCQNSSTPVEREKGLSSIWSFWRKHHCQKSLKLKHMSYKIMVLMWGRARDDVCLSLQGLLKVKDTHRPQGGLMLLGKALLKGPKAVRVLDFE